MLKEFRYNVACCFEDKELANKHFVKVSSKDCSLTINIFVSFYYRQRGTSVLKNAVYNTRYFLNLKTGQTLKYAEQRLRKKGEANKNRSISNCSFYGTNYRLPDDALNCICGEINRMMKQVHGESVPDFESYNLELSFDNLVFYIRCPYTHPLVYNEIVFRSRRYFHSFNSIPKDIIVKNTCRNPIEQIFAQSRIPAVKSLRRLAYENPRTIALLASISRSFRNVDIIRSLYMAFVCRDEVTDIYIDFSDKLFKTMLKHQSEHIVALKLLSFKRRDSNNAYRTLCDMLRCYSLLEQCDFDFSKNYTIDELHLYLAALVSDMETENKPIAYTQNELALEMSGETHSLTLAKDKREMKEVGTAMNICVGSYAGGAVNKEYTILVLRRNEDNAPVGCIEMCENIVVQAKGKHNQLLINQERAFVEKWVSDKCLNYSE